MQGNGVEMTQSTNVIITQVKCDAIIYYPHNGTMQPIDLANVFPDGLDKEPVEAIIEQVFSGSSLDSLDIILRNGG